MRRRRGTRKLSGKRIGSGRDFGECDHKQFPSERAHQRGNRPDAGGNLSGLDGGRKTSGVFLSIFIRKTGNSVYAEFQSPFRHPARVRRRMTPPPCGARKTLRTFVCLRFSSSPLLSASRTFPPPGESSAAEIPASLLNALPHLPFPGLFHDGPPTARLRRFRSRFICHRQRVTGILPLAARSRNSPEGGGKAAALSSQNAKLKTQN